jgi:hypothetical protein
MLELGVMAARMVLMNVCTLLLKMSSVFAFAALVFLMWAVSVPV